MITDPHAFFSDTLAGRNACLRYSWFYPRSPFFLRGFLRGPARQFWLEPWCHRRSFFHGAYRRCNSFPCVGYLLDRFGTKKIVCSGCLILALGLLLSSTIDSLWQLYIFFGLISAVGITFSGMVPHVFLVSESFASNRASAISFVYAGTGVGILLLAPL